MTDIYKNYKLSSGDEIVGILAGNDLDTITINRPMVLKTITLQNQQGETKEMMMFRPWNNMSNELTCKIKREHIVLESTPIPDVIEAYNQQIEKEDIVHDLYSDLMNDPERMESYIKDMIENNINPEEFQNTENDEKSNEDENVQMNFVVPHSMFLAFLMNGIISLDPDEREDDEKLRGLDFNIQEFLKNMSPKRKPSKKMDFDEYFKNWNPEP